MILAVPKNAITPKQKELLTKKGYVVIECDNPESIRVINPEQSMDTSDWFMAALKACTCRESIVSTNADKFVNELYSRLKSKELTATELSNPTTDQP